MTLWYDAYGKHSGTILNGPFRMNTKTEVTKSTLQINTNWRKKTIKYLSTERFKYAFGSFRLMT